MPNQSNINTDKNMSLGKDFVAKSPGWLTRYGIGLIALLLLLVLLLSAFIKYPDKIAASAVITSQKPPIRLKTPRQAVLDQLFVQQGQIVKKGDLLAVFEHEGNLNYALVLDSLLTLWQSQISAIPNELPTMDFPGYLANSYKVFENAYVQYLYEIEKDYSALKTRNLKQQILSLQSINSGVLLQLTLRDKSLQITKSQLERDSNLFLEGSVSAIDYENTQKRYYGLLESKESLKGQILENNLKISQLEGQILDINQEKSDVIIRAEQRFQEALGKLSNDVKNWKAENLVIAPANGSLQIKSDIQAYKFLNAGEEMFIILPEQDDSGIRGVAIIPFSASGKIKPGATIHLKLAGFPFKEYGLLQSTVKEIAVAPSGELGYEIFFDLPDTLVTTFGKEIPLKQEMKGTAEVITDKQSLLNRLFKEFTHLIKNR